MTLKEEFIEYIADRSTCADMTYGKTPLNKNNQMLYMDLPNNLRYLDALSQEIIRSVNKPNISLWEKLIAVFLFRLVGDSSVWNRMNYEYIGCPTLNDIEDIALLVNKWGIDSSFQTPLSFYPDKEYFIKTRLSGFIDSIPSDSFFRWSVYDIFLYYTQGRFNVELPDWFYYNLAQDISYINDLLIEQTMIKTHFSNNFNNFIYKTVFGRTKNYTRKFIYFENKLNELSDIVHEIYSENCYTTTKEGFYTPNDAIHMLNGFYKYKHSLFKPRSASIHKGYMDSALVPLSIVRYYHV